MFINFLKDNYRWLCCILVEVIILLISIFKKKKVINEMDTILLCVLEKLPEFILSVEGVKGAELKKSLVIEAVKKFVKDKFSINLSDTFISFVSASIEDILSTPQKKEVIE